jgi:mannose-6-phosphate isomerase-like protein (cupin superfamily)
VRADSFKEESVPAVKPPINLAAKLSMVQEHWSPRVVAELNDYQFRVVKLQGDFVWHVHEAADEAFLVLSGQMEIVFRDGSVKLGPEELYVVPRGVEHITRADSECQSLIIEPRGVVNTGEDGGPLTARNDLWI